LFQNFVGPTGRERLLGRKLHKLSNVEFVARLCERLALPTVHRSGVL
jgi:hypothetical protein